MRTDYPGVLRTTYELATPEEFFNAVSGATLQAEFLAGKPAVARIERFIGPNWAIDFFEAGMKARIFGPTLPGWASVCLVLDDTDTRMYGQPCGAGHILCNPPGVPIEGCIVPGFRGVAVSVPGRVWEDCRTSAGADAMHGFCIAELPTATSTAITSSLAAVRECLRGLRVRCADCDTPALAGESLARELVTLAWEFGTRSRPVSASIRNRHRLAQRAEVWIRDRVGEPIGIPDICREFRVSRRELEYAFRTAFAESPLAFLHALRMNAARIALHRAPAGSTVTAIALAHGFTHLGRFATEFHARFGEHPSQALRARC